MIKAAIPKLEHAGIPEAQREARLLMRWASDLDGAALSVALDSDCSPEERERFEHALDRRLSREPMSHITGTRLFWGREFRVTADVLDPRPETEVLIAEALSMGPFKRVLDLGTGTGCIAITLLAEWAFAKATATDVSAKALEIAMHNAKAIGVSDRLSLETADWGKGLSGTFDLIISNPPYLAECEMADIAPELRHEPRSALTPGADGLEAYRRIAVDAAALLAPDGVLLVEISATQAQAVEATLITEGWNLMQRVLDLDSRPRAVTARR